MYRKGVPLRLGRSREIGTCRWGHPFYITERKDGTLDVTGANVAERIDGDYYCAACHRCRVALDKGWKRCRSQPTT